MTFYGPYADIYKAKWEQAKKRIEDMGITVEYIDYTMFSKAASILYDGPGWQSAGKISVISWRATREKYFR